MNSLDVLLINPPSEDFDKNRFQKLSQSNLQMAPPLGLCYIAAVLEQNEISVRILDMDALSTPISDIRRFLQRLNPRIVGIRTISLLVHYCLKIAQIIKDWNPDTIVVFGGIHATLFPVEILESGKVDVVVREDGEYAMLELVHHFFKGRPSFSEILGIHYKEHDLIKATPRRPLETNLDKFPFPARHLLLGRANEVYFSLLAKRQPITSMVFSRGCPFQCTFCSRMYNSIRLRSKENVMEEIRSLTEHAKYPIRHIDFMDSEFNISQKYSISLCREIAKAKCDFQWRAIFRPDLMNTTLGSYLRTAGCYITTIGSEVGSDRILAFLKKGYTTSQIIQAFKLARNNNLETHTVLMMGVPGETTRDLELTRNFINKIRPDYLQLQVYAPLPGCELYDLLLAKKIYTHEVPFSEFKHLQTARLNLKNLPNNVIKNHERLTLLRYYSTIPFLAKMGKKFLLEPKRFPRSFKYMLRQHFATLV